MEHIFILTFATTCYCSKKWQIKSKYCTNKPESVRKWWQFLIPFCMCMLSLLLFIYIFASSRSLSCSVCVSRRSNLTPPKSIYSWKKSPLAYCRCICCRIKTEIFIFALQHRHINGNLIVRYKWNYVEWITLKFQLHYCRDRDRIDTICTLYMFLCVRSRMFIASFLYFKWKIAKNVIWWLSKLDN